MSKIHIAGSRWEFPGDFGEVCRDLVWLGDSFRLLHGSGSHLLLELDDLGSKAFEAYPKTLGRALCSGLRQNGIELPAHESAIATEDDRKRSIASIDDTNQYTAVLRAARRDRQARPRCSDGAHASCGADAGRGCAVANNVPCQLVLVCRRRGLTVAGRSSPEGASARHQLVIFVAARS
jgi:hypothetical protein